MKKLIAVLLCVAMMCTFLTVFSFAADGNAAGGSETILSMLLGLLKDVDWSSILSVLSLTFQTLLRIFGQG